MREKRNTQQKGKLRSKKTMVRMVQKTALYEKDDLMTGRSRNKSRTHTPPNDLLYPLMT